MRQIFKDFEHPTMVETEKKMVFGNLVHACEFKLMKTVVPYCTSAACVTNTELFQTISRSF